MLQQLRLLLKKQPGFFIPFALFVLGGLLLLAFVPKVDLFLWMNAQHHPLLDIFFPWLTHLGDGLFALPFLFYFILTNYRSALTALACFIAVVLVTHLGKQILFEDALRPSAFFEALNQSIRLVDGVTVHTNNSFPSGHSATIFGLCVFLATQFSNKGLGIFLFFSALIIAYTRVYIAQHFFGDLVAGSLVGVLTVLVVVSAMNVWFAHKPAAWHGRGLLR